MMPSWMSWRVYLMAEFDITDYIQATFGVRYEEAEQVVNTFRQVRRSAGSFC